MSAAENVFWDDLAEDLENPELRHHYILESERIAAIDAIINQLDEVRTEQGLSKAQLARAIERTPETVRRLFTARTVNPQFSVVAEMAAVLGYRVTLTPMTAAVRKTVAEPLRELAEAV
jgi:DNA-binding XRE family transcriptional regulator